MFLPCVVQSNCPMWVSRVGEQQLQILKLHISILSCYFSSFTFSDASHKVIATQLHRLLAVEWLLYVGPPLQEGLNFTTFGSAIQSLTYLVATSQIQRSCSKTQEY